MEPLFAMRSLESLKKPSIVLSALLLFAISIIVVYLSISQVKPIYSHPFPNSNDTTLQEVLQRAATHDKIVILTTSNEPWSAPNSIVDMMLDSMRRGNGTGTLINHLVIVSLDHEAHARCEATHPHCYNLIKTLSDHKEALFMTPKYIDLLWERTALYVHVLQMGYSFLAADADIMWFQDPFPHIFPEADIVTACDTYRGNPNDMRNPSNLGFYFTKSNNRTIKFFKYFYAAKDRFPGKMDQDVFQLIKRDAFVSDIGLRVMFQDTVYFSGFCERSRDFNLVCTMHANCCKGLQRKIMGLDLARQDWFKFYNLSDSEKAQTGSYIWRVPKSCW